MPAVTEEKLPPGFTEPRVRGARLHRAHHDVRAWLGVGGQTYNPSAQEVE